SLACGRSRPLAWCSRPRKRATSPARPLRCAPVRWKGPVLALLGAAAVVGIAIGFTLGGGDGTTITDASGTTDGGSSQTASTTTGTGASTPLLPLPSPGESGTGREPPPNPAPEAGRNPDRSPPHRRDCRRRGQAVRSESRRPVDEDLARR